MCFKGKQPEKVLLFRIGYRTILRDVEKLLISQGSQKQKEICYNGCIHFSERSDYHGFSSNRRYI